MNHSSSLEVQLKNNDTFNFKGENGIILIVSVSILTFFTIVFNSILFVAIVRSLMWSRKRNISQHHSNQSITKLIMTSFVADEMLLGAFLMPLCAAELMNDGHWRLGRLACIVRNFVSGWTSQVSISHIFCMAVDRFLAIKHPLLYRRLTLRHGLGQVASAWLIPLVALMVCKLMDGYHDMYDIESPSTDIHNICTMIFNIVSFTVMYTFLFVLPLLIAIFLYIAILMEVHNFHIRTGRYKEREHQLPVVESMNSKNKCLSWNELNNSNSETNTSHTLDAKTNFEHQDVLGKVSEISKSAPKCHRKSLKAYKTVGCIILCILACWIPPYTLSAAYVFNKSLLSISVQTHLLFIFYIHAAINPLIYMFNRSIRQSVKNLLYSTCCSTI